MLSQKSKIRSSVWPGVLTFLCLVSLAITFVSAQEGGFLRPRGNSVYKDGSVQKPTPGVSKFEPSARTTPTFGQGTIPPLSTGKPQPTQGFGSQTKTQTQGFGAQVGSVSGSEVGEFAFCTVEFKDEIDLPALETGQLTKMNVKEGDSVTALQVIAMIDDKLLKHELMVALVRKQNAYRTANDRTSIEAADKQIQLNRQIFESTARLERKGARSADEKRTARYEYEVAVLQREAAVSRQLEAQGEAELENVRETQVKERIRRHEVTATFAGVVIDRYKQAGEWVTAGEPVAKVARMDKLYVTGLISNNEYNPSEIIGKDVVVSVKLARDQVMEFPGKIALIGSKDIIGTGNEFKVKAEITNKKMDGQWVLRKETRVSMRINVK